MARRTRPDADPPAEPTVHTDVGRGIDLPPEAAFFATWRDTPPLPRPEPRPFDKADCLGRLQRVKGVDYGNPDWDAAGIAPAMTREEADFWLAAIVQWCEGKATSVVAAGLQSVEFTGEVGLSLARELFKQPRRPPPPELAGVLANLLGPVRFLDLLAAGDFRQAQTHYWARGQNELALVRGCWERVRPYLTADELEQVRTGVRPRLDPRTWPKKHDDPLPMPYYVAALAGMHDEVWGLARGWQFGPTDPARYVFNYSAPLLVLLGLRDPALLETKARELNLSLHTRFDLRAWMAHTGVGGLDYAAEQVQKQRWGNRPLIEELGRARDPAVARHMLALKVRGKNPAPARAWLDENVGSAVAGLIPLTAGRDKVGRAAVEYLCDVVKRGLGWVIERELAAADPQTAGRVRRAVLDRPERAVPAFEPGEEPDWVAEVAATVPKPKGSPPGWLNPATLPPLVAAGRRLADAHVAALLTELRTIPGGSVAPFAAAVCQHADPASRDAFATELFERWLAEKAPYPDSWVIAAVGRLGGDAAVDALVPRLKRWPGGASSRRIKDGLAAVRAVGTDYALAQLAHLALVHPNRRARAAAAENLSAAAAERGLTSEQLEDRTVPDLGLYAGGPVLDYGPRQFRFALAPDLRPGAKDDRGRLHAALPTPRKTDDPLLVAEARESFRLLKAQAAEVVAAVCQRLERGLVHQRRWAADDFGRFLVRHPLTGAVARRLVWGRFAPDGSLAGTFRVTEEGEYAGPDDRPAAVAANDQVGLVHPVQMTADERTAWAERFADYEVVPPFPQLARPVFDLTEAEAAAVEVMRFNAKQVPYGRAITKAVKEHGWTRRDSAVRPFPAAGVTAVVKLSGWDKVEVHGCIFLPRVDANAVYDPKQAVPLGQVDPVARCEVFADLDAWAKAAGQS